MISKSDHLILIWANFKVKIRQYDFAEKSGSSSEISVKLVYLSQIATWAHRVFLGYMSPAYGENHIIND
jgi:hypothetical protein